MPDNPADNSNQPPRRKPPLVVRWIVAGVTGVMPVLAGLNLTWLDSYGPDVSYLLVYNLIIGLPAFLFAIGLLLEPEWWGDYRRTQIALQALHTVCFGAIVVSTVMAFAR